MFESFYVAFVAIILFLYFFRKPIFYVHDDDDPYIPSIYTESLKRPSFKFGKYDRTDRNNISCTYFGEIHSEKIIFITYEHPADTYDDYSLKVQAYHDAEDVQPIKISKDDFLDVFTNFLEFTNGEIARLADN